MSERICPYGCIDLFDPLDPPEVRMEGRMAVPGCPIHDPEGEPFFGTGKVGDG